MTESTVKLITASIGLVKVLVWPAMLLWLIHHFRSEISRLLSRLGSVKVAGSEWVFQPPSPKAEEEPTIKLRSTEFELGPDDFLTADSRRNVIQQSQLFEKGERVVSELLIFQTPTQRTWLVSTNRKVFVLLDDAGTRKNMRVIQTTFDRDRALPLEFDDEKGVESVKFAAEDTYWYYSEHLFPTKKSLTDAVTRLVSTDH